MPLLPLGRQTTASACGRMSFRPNCFAVCQHELQWELPLIFPDRIRPRVRLTWRSQLTLTIFKEVLDYGQSKKAVLVARCSSGTDFVRSVPGGAGAPQSMSECSL